jgi:hypothetical protein
MNTIPELAILMIETEKDRAVIPGVMDDIRTSLFNQEPKFVVVSGEGDAKCLSVALNRGIRAAIKSDCRYIFWAHPDMQFPQPNWHLPLMRTLDTKPSVMKVCAANSRDQIVPGLRMGHEQSWMMRASDFTAKPWLFFNESFVGIGGYEDLYQSYQIITHGRLVLINSQSQVFHKGMGTRSQRDTRPEQFANHDRYLALVGNTDDPHQWQNFALALDADPAREAAARMQADFPPTEDPVNSLYLHTPDPVHL